MRLIQIDSMSKDWGHLNPAANLANPERAYQYRLPESSSCCSRITRRSASVMDVWRERFSNFQFF
jgi:hypothetical protein